MSKLALLAIFSFVAVLFLGVEFTGQALAADKTFEEPVIGAKGYHLGSYGGGAYWITDGRTNSMFIVTDEGVIVIDAPPS